MLIFPTGQGKSGLQCSVKSLMTLNSEQRELATSQAPTTLSQTQKACHHTNSGVARRAGSRGPLTQVAVFLLGTHGRGGEGLPPTSSKMWPLFQPAELSSRE